MSAPTDDLRIDSLRPLLPPAILMEEIPISDAARSTVMRARRDVARIIAGDDRRLMVVVGPCSVHDPAAAREYGARLRPLADELSPELCLVMRTYFEKPRTVVGWKGLINDPGIDGSFRINDGLRIARRLLLDLAESGLPPGTEFLDPISPQFVADLVSWGAIGARTTESQVHREMASGLSMPVGFKNATDGTIRIAIEAVQSAQHRHRFLGVTKEGISAIVTTRGNPDCHVILRGGDDGPNYDRDHIERTAATLADRGLAPRLMVDCSHANSRKDHERQALVAEEVARQLQDGNRHICGVMLESFLVPGRQDVANGQALTYGQSITDACMGWDLTVEVLRNLARAAARRT